jgi:broad specificity phosphatase PhoE
MRLYIRHAEKIHANGKGGDFSHDSSITDRGREYTRQITEDLIEIYGKPTKIISSPFLRTRETAMIMAEVSGLENIIIDNSISEFLGNWKVEDVKISPDTSQYKPKFGENLYEFERRIYGHLSESYKQDNVWYVTHGIVISTITKICQGRKFKPKTLEHIIF